MIFTETSIDGAFLVDIRRIKDHRGFFARAWSAAEFGAVGLPTEFTDMNFSLSTRRGTIRGIHYQKPPHSEAKFVRCVSGSLYDVIIDLRPESPTYLKWAAYVIDSARYQAIFVPKGCAHGMQSLEDGTAALYMTSAAHHPASECGIRWNDPFFAIEWPYAESPVISDKDLSWPDCNPSEIRQSV
jgi:dTDP-4-dehydrorhamnose 3,5-epimerase